MLPKILTELPGPEARKVLEKDKRFISQSYTRVYPLVVKKAKEVWVEDVDSNRYLDFTSGIAVCNTGYCHPRIVAAIHQQAEQLIHMSGTDFYYAAQSDLAERLAGISPGPKDKRVFFGNSGAEAIEAALKLARYHTKRSRIIAFLGAFHGRTMGALSLTASKVIQEKGFFPLVPGITHVPYAYCYRCPAHSAYPGCGCACVEWIREDLFKRSLPPEEVAAIFVEPIQGEAAISSPRSIFIKNFTSWQRILASSLSLTRFRPAWAVPERCLESSTGIWPRTSSPSLKGLLQGCRWEPWSPKVM